MSDGSANDSPMSREVIELLEPLLGRFTARKAVEIAAEQCGTTLEDFEAVSTACVCERLRPVLRTLLGAQKASSLLRSIAALAEREEVES